MNAPNERLKLFRLAANQAVPSQSDLDAGQPPAVSDWIKLLADRLDELSESPAGQISERDEFAAAACGTLTRERADTWPAVRCAEWCYLVADRMLEE